MPRRLPTHADRLPRLARPVVCATCRTALPVGEACDLCRDEHLFNLARVRQRGAFIDHVWSELARRRTQVASEPSLNDILVGGDEGVDLIALGTWVARAAKRRFFAIKPCGVRRGVAAPKRSRTFVGVARRRDHMQLAPLSGRRCLAFGVLFTHLASAFRSAVTLRDAVAVEFDVELGDGSIVRVPGGRVRLALRSTESVRPRGRVLREYLEEIDPLQRAAEPTPPYPFQRIGEVMLRPGQVVEVRGDFEPKADTSARSQGLSYRAPPPTILVATGTPWLRVRS